MHLLTQTQPFRGIISASIRERSENPLSASNASDQHLIPNGSGIIF